MLCSWCNVSHSIVWRELHRVSVHFCRALWSPGCDSYAVPAMHQLAGGCCYPQREFASAKLAIFAAMLTIAGCVGCRSSHCTSCCFRKTVNFIFCNCNQSSSWRNYFFPSAIVVIFSESCVDVILPTDVISVTSVVLGISRRTIGTESRERFNNGSDSLLLPSIHERASGPNFRTNAWMSKSTESIKRIPL